MWVWSPSNNIKWVHIYGATSMKSKLSITLNVLFIQVCKVLIFLYHLESLNAHRFCPSFRLCMWGSPCICTVLRIKEGEIKARCICDGPFMIIVQYSVCELMEKRKQIREERRWSSVTACFCHALLSSVPNCVPILSACWFSLVSGFAVHLLTH